MCLYVCCACCCASGAGCMAYQCRGDAREMRKLEKGEARRLEFPPESFSAPGEPLLTDEDEQDYRQYENAVFVEKSAESGSLKIWYKTYFPASEGDITCIIVGYHPYISNSEYLMKNHARCLRHFEKAAVILFDQPSCGRSDGLWGFMPSWEDHVALTEKFVRKVVVPLRDRITSEQHKFIPIYGFGEDIGANVLATSALRSPDIYNGIILASPFIRDGDAVKAGGFANFLAKCEGSIFPKYPGAPLKEALDKRFVDKDFSDYTSTENKLMWRMPLRMKTNKSIKQGQKWLEKHSAELTTPILILQSSNDKITSPDGSKLLYDLCGSKDKCIKMYDDCPEAGLKYAHELLSAEPAEMSKPVYNDITTWVSARKIRAEPLHSSTPRGQHTAASTPQIAPSGAASAGATQAAPSAGATQAAPSAGATQAAPSAGATQAAPHN